MQGIKSYFDDIAINRFKLTKALSVFDPKINLERLKLLNKKIDKFESHHANRLYQAYDILGPMLKESKEGETDENFRKYWRSGAKLRYTITTDLDRLRAQAIKISKDNNSQEELKFPTYAKFIWE